jgi:outer membrane protein assembly factor BamB
MAKKSLINFILPLFILSALGLLTWWFIYDPVRSFKVSVPGMDNRKKGLANLGKPVKIGAEFTFFKAEDDVAGTSWNRFRGPDFDNISKEPIRLIDHFGKNGPQVLWKVILGEGHAAPAVYNGKVYLLDYDEASKADQLRCFSLSTGVELWRRGYRSP